MPGKGVVHSRMSVTSLWPPQLPGHPVPPTPRHGLCHPQAALLEAFVSKQQLSSRASVARAAWLVQQQELAQEEAECEAAWAAACGADPARAAKVDSCGQAADAGEASLWAALQAADGRLGEALAVAAATTSLLDRGEPPLSPPSTTPAAVQQQLQAAAARLSEAVAAVDAALQQQRLPRSSSASICGSEAGASSTDLAEQVQSLLDAHPLAAPPCRAQLLQQAAQAEARHAEQRHRCKAALHAFHSGAVCAGGPPQLAPDQLPHMTAEDSCAASPDGWPAGEHAVFVHACRACLAPGGGGQAALVRRLEAGLPWRSSQAVLAHERWHREATRLQAALQQAEAGWQQEQTAFLGAAAGLLSEAEAAALAGAEAALAQLEAGAACLQSSRSHEAAQAAWSERRGAESLANAEAVAAAAAQRFGQWQAQEDYNARLKQLLAQHRQRQAQAAVAAAAAEQEDAAQRRREAAAAAAAGEQRVAYRAGRAAAKQAVREEAAAARQAEHARRAAALDALRLRAAPAARRDAARATGPTESSAAALAAGRARHGLLAGAVVGLTSKQVLSDQRFKVRVGSRDW